MPVQAAVRLGDIPGGFDAVNYQSAGLLDLGVLLYILHFYNRLSKVAAHYKYKNDGINFLISDSPLAYYKKNHCI